MNSKEAGQPWLRTPRDPKRIDRILELIRIQWKQAPDLRLGQLLANTAPELEKRLFFFEDSDLETALENHQ